MARKSAGCPVLIYALNRLTRRVTPLPRGPNDSEIGSWTARGDELKGLILRDVGVAGSNPVTPTIDFHSFFISYRAPV
jgi:hypothetical protein